MSYTPGEWNVPKLSKDEFANQMEVADEALRVSKTFTPKIVDSRDFSVFGTHQQSIFDMAKETGPQTSSYGELTSTIDGAQYADIDELDQHDEFVRKSTPHLTSWVPGTHGSAGHWERDMSQIKTTHLVDERFCLCSVPGCESKLLKTNQTTQRCAKH